MFIRKNSFFYFLGLAIFAWAAFKYWGQIKQNTEQQNATQQEVKKPEVQEVQEKTIQIDVGNLQESIEAIREAVDVLEDAKAQAQASMPKFRSKYKNLIKSPTKIGMCGSDYTIDISVLDENGDLLFENKNLAVSSLKEDKVFYTTLVKMLILTPEKDTIEIFVSKLEFLPKLFLKNAKILNQAGFIIIKLKDITGNSTFNPSAIKSFVTANAESMKERGEFGFFCGDRIEAKYTLSNAKGIKIAEQKVKLTLGKHLGRKDQILEYLILSSRESKIDAIVPAGPFLSKSNEEVIIIKGDIITANVQ